MRIAIVGAGISGLSCADRLLRRSHVVRLFDKGRGPGGRMSTRRVEVQGRTVSFDHGAQYFTVQDATFAQQVDEWEQEGAVARWQDAGRDAWVGVPGMNAPVKSMATRHEIAWATNITGLERHAGTWALVGAPGAGDFDAVIIAVPAEQAASLLGRVQLCFATAAESICSSPCWTAMVAFASPVRTNLRVVRHRGAIGWAARDGSKPGRGDQESWVVQAAPGWSSEHLECSAEEAAEQLLGLLQEALAESLPEPIHLSAHRWRYSRPNPTKSLTALWDSAVNIGVCGDWLIAPRIESAWLSGQRLATLIG